MARIVLDDTERRITAMVLYNYSLRLRFGRTRDSIIYRELAIKIYPSIVDYMEGKICVKRGKNRY